MSEDDPANIFEAASRMFGSSKKKKKKKKVEPADGRTEGPSEEQLKEYDDISGAFERMREYHRELDQQILSAFEKANINRRQLREFIKDPGNFTGSEWNVLRQSKKEEERKLWSLAGQEARDKLQSRKKKKKKKSMQERKLRRRDGWISMD